MSTYHEVDQDIRLAYCYGPDGTGLTFVERLTEPRSSAQYDNSSQIRAVPSPRGEAEVALGWAFP